MVEREKERRRSPESVSNVERAPLALAERRGRRVHCGIVMTGPHQPPHRGDVCQHARTVAREANLAALLMAPAHWNFLQREAGAVRHEQQFDIEAEPIDGGGFEERAADTHSKRFESALGVEERETGCDPEGAIEQASRTVAIKGLGRFDQPAIDGSRPERDVARTAGDAIDQFRKLGNWC